MTILDRIGGELPRGRVAVELDDIQATVLRYRPEPYYGTHVMLHVDDVRAGREFLRSVTPHIDSAWEGWPGIRSPHAKDYLAEHQVTAEGWYVGSPDLTVVETRRLQRIGQAVEEFLDKVGD